MAASDVVIAVIGACWAGPRADGTWRIFDDDDVVRWELGMLCAVPLTRCTYDAEWRPAAFSTPP